MPDDVRKQRVDRIYKLAKNAMQYVTAGTMKLVEAIVIVSLCGSLSSTTSRDGRTT